jgi:integrase
MTRINLRYVHGFIDKRRGRAKARFYFRRRGCKQVPLPGLPGSPEFNEAYAAALAEQSAPRLPIGAGRVRAGSIGALTLAYFHSAPFLALSPSTQRKYRNILERFAGEHGDKPLAPLTTQHIKAMLARKAATPAAANYWLRLMKTLMRFAVDEGMRRDNPALAIAQLKSRATGGIHSWTEEEIAQFEAHYPIGTKPRLALALLLYTAQRGRSDVVPMGPQHVSNGVLRVQQQKTGKALRIPLHPALQAILSATPNEHLTFLVTTYGKPFTAGSFGNWFRDRCAEAGLPKECAAHGLRKAACRRLAEAGCSEKQIAAISGHATLREVERYTKAADQERMARDAMEIVSRTEVATAEKPSGNRRKITS